ncbi:MAG: hypothetical protein ACTSQJ_19240 [Promethearchaeota archaeon]
MFKKFINNLQDKLSLTSNAIKEIIKENTQYLDAELNVVKEASEAILVLKNYATSETPSLEAAISELAKTFESIEDARKEKVSLLKEKFIEPLNDLLSGFNARQQEIKEAEVARKALEKAQTKLNKLKAKPKEKLKPGQKEAAEEEVKKCEEAYKKESEDVKIANEKFNRQKLETLQAILTSLHDIEKEFHEKALKLFGAVKEKAEAIKIEEESVIEDQEEEIEEEAEEKVKE